MAKLIINPTSGARKEIPMGGPALSIGRDPSNDLVLSDSMVSRRHAVLELRGEHYVLKDNNSSNGTLVNGDRITSEQALRDGDLISIGSARLLFQLDSSLSSVTAEGGEETRAPDSRPSPSEPPRCGACGTEAAPSDHFCRRCGRELSALSLVTCGSCGASVPLPASYCGACGNALLHEDKKHYLPTEPLRRESLNPNGPNGASAAASRSIRAPSTVNERPQPGSVGSSKGSQKTAPSPVPFRRAPGAAVKTPAGLGVRFVASLIDTAVIALPWTGANLLWAFSHGSRRLDSPIDWGADPSLPMAGAALTLILAIAYPLYFWTTRSATPGKMALGLQIVTATGGAPIGAARAAGRLAGCALSGLLFGLGFLMIGFSEEKRGLHDRLAGTRVVRMR